MNEQINLFDTDNDSKVSFYVYYRNKDWSIKTRTVDGISGILDWFEIELTKSELKEVCRKAIKIGKPSIFGYEVFFEDDEGKKEIFVRFLNYTTRRRRTVFEHIDLYFNEVVSWRKESGASETV